MEAGALESVTTTSGNLIWASLELGVWRPVTAAPENIERVGLVANISAINYRDYPKHFANLL